jgi:hypothetical protein
MLSVLVLSSRFSVISPRFNIKDPEERPEHKLLSLISLGVQEARCDVDRAGDGRRCKHTAVSRPHRLYSRIPAAPELLSPILEIVPLQLFAYYVAAKRGLDVDHPRNLVKAVTLE